MPRVDRHFTLPGECVLTVGKFESLHLGHKWLIHYVMDTARERNMASAAVTFEPNPRTFLSGSAYKPLFSAKERAHIWSGLGVDHVVTYPFDHAFSEILPEDFCDMLYGNLKGRVLVVGEGYRFGHNRAGDLDVLQKKAKEYGAEINVLPHRETEDGKIGTRAIRGFLEARRPDLAAKLLGFPFFIIGQVGHGKKLGRILGFPTVNIGVSADRFLPPDGVYATVTSVNGKTYKSVTNIGVKPTVSAGGQGERTVESFLIGYDGVSLYGDELKTDFLQFIRNEIKFNDIGVLRNQIEKDVRTHEKI
jgi:riboflavin kinase/FMN adenylyltransferase